jgi:hypothetical protein
MTNQNLESSSPQPSPTVEESALEVVVGVFESQDQVNFAATALKNDDLKFHRISQGKGMTDEMPNIVYEDVEEISAGAVAQGAISGGAIGVGSGLLLLGVPVLNVLAPVAAGLAGAWIGAVAGADEANRAIELPGQDEYRRLLAEGKSFLIVSGSEQQRIQFANEMQKHGALEVHQHPPTREAVRSRDTE